MDYKSRRYRLAFALALLVLSGGCLSTQTADSPHYPDRYADPFPTETRTNAPLAEPAGGGGFLQAKVVAEPPGGTEVIDSTDDRLDGLEIVRDLLQKAVEDGGEYYVKSRTISEGEMTDIKSELEKLPRYENPSPGPEQPSGYYFRHENRTVAVRLVVEE